MLWFLVWTGLILAWLVGAFFGLRWLWRQVKDFMEVVGQAGELLERLESGSSFTAVAVRPVDVWAGPEQLDQVRRARDSRHHARRQRRRAAHQRTYDRWAKLAGYAP